MKRKNHLTINTNVGLRTPRTGKKSSNVVYSGKGSGAILSNRRGRFWNSNARGSKSGRKSMSPNKRNRVGDYSSSKKYNKNFVNKMENFQTEIDEFKVEVDHFLSSP